MKRSFSLFVLVLVTLAITAGEASANTNVLTWFHDNFRFSNRSVNQTCGFRVGFHAFGPYKAVDQYDDNGVLFRSIVTSGGGGYHFTATANGVTLETQASYMIITTFNPDGSVASSREDGLHFGFTAPGEGVVLVDTGRLDVDPETGEILFEGGPRQFLHGDLDAFCAAFR